MDLNQLNKLANVSVKPILKVQTLNINQQYKIIVLRSVFSKKLGKPAIICELDNGIIYLPRRFVDNLKEDDLVALNKQNLAIVYLGSINVGKLNPASNLKFVNLDADASGSN